MAARDAAARRPGGAARGARELSQPLRRRPLAVFGVLTALDHLRGEQGHPRARHPLGLTEQGDVPTGRSAREAYGDGTPDDIAHEPHGLLDIGELGRLGGRRRLD